MTTTYTAPNGTRIRIREVYWPVTGSKGDAYRVTRYPDGEYRCNCPARVVCKHIMAADRGDYGPPRYRVMVLPTRPNLAWAHLETPEY